MNKKKFLKVFSKVYEKSPWVAEKSWNNMNNEFTFENISKSMSKTVDESSTQKKLKLLCSHPDLAIKFSKYSELTEDSKKEQSSAGLNTLTDKEYLNFNNLNSQYKNKFKFPFILAVSGKDKFEILKSFKKRLENEYTYEFNEALNQVHKIAQTRIKDILK